MLELILLIVGIFKFNQRSKLNKLTEQDFPKIDSEKFTTWFQAQLKATDIFLFATWGAFFIKLLFLGLLSGEMNRSPEISGILYIVIIVAWIIGLIISSIYTRKANDLKLAAGINWPK